MLEEDENLSYVRKFEGLRHLLQPMEYNANESIRLDETNGLTNDECSVKDKSSLGIIDLETMKGKSFWEEITCWECG